MISTGRGLKCRYVVFGVGIGIETIRLKNKSVDKCNCSAEVKLLRGTMSVLQADILTMKQSMYANDRLRDEHTYQNKAAVTDLKRCVLGCMVNDCDTSNSTKIAMRKISSSAVVGHVIALEDRVRSMETVLETHIETS